MSWSSGVSRPSMAVQRMRSWASTAQSSQAALALKLPDGHVLEAGPFFQVPDGELDGGVVAVEGVDFDRSPRGR